MRMKRLVVMLLALVLTASPAMAKKQKSLPPGLQKKVERGGELPPGWQQKLAKGEVLDRRVFDQGTVVRREKDKGLVTIKVEGKLIKVIENTMEIIDILK